MAVTQFAFGIVSMNSLNSPGPWLAADSIIAEDVEPTAATAATDAAAPNAGGVKPVCRVSTDTDVYVSFGPEPDAEVDTNRVMVIAGYTETFYVNSGDKAAVVTVAGE